MQNKSLPHGRLFVLFFADDFSLPRLFAALGTAHISGSARMHGNVYRHIGRNVSVTAFSAFVITRDLLDAKGAKASGNEDDEAENDKCDLQ